MHEEITLHRIGGSASAPLPKAMLDRHQIEPGDKVFAIDTDAGILITAFDPEVAEWLREWASLHAEVKGRTA
jgi:antitoxin component of MazEF toxin-antitoxin module